MQKASQALLIAVAPDISEAGVRLTLVGPDDCWALYGASLRGTGYQVHHSRDLSDLRANEAAARADLLVVQVDHADFDGFNFARELGADAGIVALTSRFNAETRITLLDAGVDVCLDALSEPAELAANIQSVLRRVLHNRERVVLVGEVRIYLERGKVIDRDGLPVALSPGEFRILEGLATAHGDFVSSEALSRTIRPDSTDPKVSSVAVLISNLRKKLHDVDRQRPLIINAPHAGYRLVTGFRPASEGAAAPPTRDIKSQIASTPSRRGPRRPDPVALYLYAARKERRLSRLMVEKMTDGWVTASELARYETGYADVGNDFLISLLRKLYGVSRSKLDRLSQSAASVEDEIQ